MKTHAERFRHLLEVWGLTQEELGSLCGIKRGTVGTIVNGKTTPDGDALATLLRSKPDLNPDWLLTGTGPMLRDGRALSPAPAPEAAPPRTMQVVTESGELRAVKDERDNLRRMVEMLTNLLAGKNSPGAATGTDGSFNPGDQDAAENYAHERIEVAGLVRYQMRYQLAA